MPTSNSKYLIAKGIKLQVNSNIHVPAVICMLITVERCRFRFESSDSDDWIDSLLSDLKMKEMGLLTIFQMYHKMKILTSKYNFLIYSYLLQ